MEQRNVEAAVAQATEAFRKLAGLAKRPDIQPGTRKEALETALEAAQIIRDVVKEYRGQSLYSPVVETSLAVFRTELGALWDWCQAPTRH